MKVLQVGSGLHGWAGIEKYVLFLQEGLSQRGHDVSVSVTPGTPLANAFTGNVFEVPVHGKFDLRALAAYVRLFRSESFDLVHTHFNPDFLIVAYAARLVGKTPLVMTRHVALPWARMKAKNFSNLYDRIIPVSEASRRKLLQSGVPSERMRVAKAGCPPVAPSSDLQSMRTSLGMQTGLNVGFFGRLAPEKGLSVLLESAASLPESITLHIFGDGPLKREVEEAANRRANVRFHGFRTDVADCMGAVDAIVIPSVWEEAFPYSALEAMSVGRPVVASRIGGLPELVDQDQNGLLFEAGNASELAAALAQLAQNPALVREMGAKGREIQLADYTLDRMAERIEQVYSEIV